MDVIARIEEQLKNNPVVLYMKGTPDFPQCGFSSQAVQILKACQAKFMAINVFEEPEIREALKTYSQWPTYPQLYIDGKLIGGCDIMLDLYNSGKLASLLAATSAA